MWKDLNPLALVVDLLCGKVGLAETLRCDFKCDIAALCLSGDATPLPFRICMANIIISLLTMWQPEDANSTKEGRSIQSRVDNARQDSIVGIVKDMSTFSDQMHVDPVLRGATLQVIFIAVHQMQGDISDSGIPFGRLHALAISASQDCGSPELRLAGLKLLGILIGKVKGIFSKVLAGAAGHTKSVLGQIANIDSSEKVRKIAESLLVSAFR